MQGLGESGGLNIVNAPIYPVGIEFSSEWLRNERYQGRIGTVDQAVGRPMMRASAPAP